MKKFKSDHEAARLLCDILNVNVDAVVALLPNSVNIAILIAQHFDVPLIEFWDSDSFDSTQTAQKRILVVDDGVETGTRAREVASALEGAKARFLAVPVCSREIEALLLSYYQEIFAVARPFVRRSLAWHYEVMPSYSIDEARLILKTALD